jgi:hypothetical protein
MARSRTNTPRQTQQCLLIIIADCLYSAIHLNHLLSLLKITAQGSLLWWNVVTFLQLSFLACFRQIRSVFQMSVYFHCFNDFWWYRTARRLDFCIEDHNMPHVNLLRRLLYFLPLLSLRNIADRSDWRVWLLNCIFKLGDRHTHSMPASATPHDRHLRCGQDLL